MPVGQPANKNGEREFALYPLAMTPIAVLGMAVFTVQGRYGLALILGVAVGALLFVRGTAVGGRLGNARLREHSRAAVSMRLGACLALAGIAAGAQAHDPHWTRLGHAAIGLGQIAASSLALWLAARQAKLERTAKEIRAESESAAKPL